MFLLLGPLFLLLRIVVKEQDWRAAAVSHREKMISILYPESPSGTNKERQHLVHDHPIYNFLHTYYRYPVSKILSYSPGVDCNSLNNVHKI